MLDNPILADIRVRRALIQSIAIQIEHKGRNRDIGKCACCIVDGIAHGRWIVW